jgi:hypothetical protein
VRLFPALLLDLEIDPARRSTVIFSRLDLLYSTWLEIVFLNVIRYVEAYCPALVSMVPDARSRSLKFGQFFYRNLQSISSKPLEYTLYGGLIEESPEMLVQVLKSK